MARRRRHAPSGAVQADPFAVLGLPQGSTVEDVEIARRTLAKSAHPDAGGSVRDMQRINAAADEAARIAGVRATAPAAPGAHPPTAAPATPAPATAAPQTGAPLHWRVDHPSFTVEALPAESFEALLVVASWLGETIDDDPPYRLDVELVEPVPCWCRLELLPDAGATTVGLAIASEVGVSERGVTAADVEAVRDAWIAGLNSLDWDAIGDSPQRP